MRQSLQHADIVGHISIVSQINTAAIEHLHCSMPKALMRHRYTVNATPVGDDCNIKNSNQHHEGAEGPLLLEVLTMVGSLRHMTIDKRQLPLPCG
jgi:hypothetical protein